jgi:hypothetical protein
MPLGFPWVCFPVSCWLVVLVARSAIFRSVCLNRFVTFRPSGLWYVKLVYFLSVLPCVGCWCCCCCCCRRRFFCFILCFKFCIMFVGYPLWRAVVRMLTLPISKKAKQHEWKTILIENFNYSSIYDAVQESNNNEANDITLKDSKLRTRQKAVQIGTGESDRLRGEEPSLQNLLQGRKRKIQRTVLQVYYQNSSLNTNILRIFAEHVQQNYVRILTSDDSSQRL